MCYSGRTATKVAGAEDERRVWSLAKTTPPKTNMTMENTNRLKVYLLLKMVIFHCHVGFSGETKPCLEKIQILTNIFQRSWNHRHPQDFGGFVDHSLLKQSSISHWWPHRSGPLLVYSGKISIDKISKYSGPSLGGWETQNKQVPGIHISIPLGESLFFANQSNTMA